MNEYFWLQNTNLQQAKMQGKGKSQPTIKFKIPFSTLKINRKTFYEYGNIDLFSDNEDQACSHCRLLYQSQQSFITPSSYHWLYFFTMSLFTQYLVIVEPGNVNKYTLIFWKKKSVLQFLMVENMWQCANAGEKVPHCWSQFSSNRNFNQLRLNWMILIFESL